MRRWSTWLGVISRFVADDLELNDGDPLVLMPPAPQDVSGTFPTRRDFSRPLRLAVMGRIAPDKGIEFAVLALSMAIKRGASAHLSIIGRGEDDHLARLVQLVAAEALEGRVVFSGWTSNSTQALKEIDVLLMTSPSEPYGRVTAEALIAGVVVAARPRGGTPEVVDHCTLCLIEEDSILALANRIVDLCEMGCDERSTLLEHVAAHRQRLVNRPDQFTFIRDAALGRG